MITLNYNFFFPSYIQIMISTNDCYDKEVSEKSSLKLLQWQWWKYGEGKDKWVYKQITKRKEQQNECR